MWSHHRQIQTCSTAPAQCRVGIPHQTALLDPPHPCLLTREGSQLERQIWLCLGPFPGCKEVSWDPISPAASAGAGGALQKPEISECWDSKLWDVNWEGTTNDQKTSPFLPLRSCIPAPHTVGHTPFFQPLFYQEGLPKLGSPGAQQDMGDISCPRALNRQKLQ